MRFRLLSRAGAALALFALATAAPAHADRWFGKITASCDSFGLCGLFPEMPDPPGDSASLQIARAGKADAPVEIRIYVNRPVEGGAPIRLELGDVAFDLKPGTDIVTRRATQDGKERTVGYWIAAPRVGEVLAALRKTSTGHLKITITSFINGETQAQDRLILLDGLDEALRYLDERQGRAGAQDAIILKGPRAAADVAVPKPLPARAQWPKEIERIFKRNNCEDRLATFEELQQGSIATPSAGHELWQVPCAGGNYNILFLGIDIRNADPKTARQLFFPTRLHRRATRVLTNPVWWDSAKEIWAFERGHSQGDCGTVVLYRWTGRGLALVNERQKEDCDGTFTDPWTTWAKTQPKRRARQ